MRRTLLIAVLAAGLVLGGCSLMPSENAGTETGAVETGAVETEGTTVEMMEEEMEADSPVADEVAPAGDDVVEPAVDAEMDAVVETEELME